MTVKYTLTFLGMFFYIYVILQVAVVAFKSPTPRFCQDLTTGAVSTWFLIEIWAFYGIIISNFIVLFMRGILGKTHLDPSRGIDPKY